VDIHRIDQFEWGTSPFIVLVLVKFRLSLKDEDEGIAPLSAFKIGLSLFEEYRSVVQGFMGIVSPPID
jgi:hypothetical protein